MISQHNVLINPIGRLSVILQSVQFLCSVLLHISVFQADAAQSILKLDNTDMDGFTISVALSCPPERKAPATPDFTPTLGGGKKEGVDR